MIQIGSGSSYNFVNLYKYIRMMGDKFFYLSKYIKFTNIVLVFVTFIEALLVVLISIGASNINVSMWRNALILCSIIYVIILIIKIYNQIMFPNKIVDELKAIDKLEKVNELLDRQNTINKFISHSIQSLNSQTCAVENSVYGDVMNDNLICDYALKDGLTLLWQPVLERTDVLLNSRIEKKFVVGIFLFNINILFENKALETDIIYLLKDDLKLNHLFTEELIGEKALTGAQFEIQTCLNRTKNNNRLSIHNFEEENKKYQMVCAPIPQLCSDTENVGELFIINENEISYPQDLESILLILNRSTVNYTEKYSSCVRYRSSLKDLESACE